VRVVEVVSYDRSRNPDPTVGSAGSRLRSIMTPANYNVNTPSQGKRLGNSSAKI
jgi:hypothetical protein